MKMLLALLFFAIFSNAHAGGKLGENCFGDGFVFQGNAFPLLARGVLEVSDLEQVAAWLAKEYGPHIEFTVDYDALKFNALASMENETRRVVLNLGLILHPKVTKDVLALIGCHEVGHHLGGAPRKVDPPLSYEGQADFFAPQSCFDRWLSMNLAGTYAIRTEVQHYCRILGPLLRGTVENCSRTMEASVLLSEVFAGIKRVPSVPRLEQQEILRVAQSISDHGTPQCRLDTFRNGFLNYQRAEMPRPGCWYKE